MDYDPVQCLWDQYQREVQKAHEVLDNPCRDEEPRDDGTVATACDHARWQLEIYEHDNRTRAIVMELKAEVKFLEEVAKICPDSTIRFDNGMNCTIGHQTFFSTVHGSILDW